MESVATKLPKWLVRPLNYLGLVKPQYLTKSAPFLWPKYVRGKAQWQMVDLRSYAEEGFSVNTLVYSSIMYKVRAITSAPLRVYRGGKYQPEPAEPDHPLSRLVDRPNEHQSFIEFQGLLTVYLNLYGNAYIYLDRILNKLPTAMHPLRPDRMRIIPNDSGGLKGYLYIPDGQDLGSGIPMLPKDVIHIKFPNPIDPLEGMGFGLSPMSALAHSGDVDNAVTSFLRKFFEGGTMMQGLLTFDTPLGQEKVDQIRERWKEKYGGWDNWDEIGVLDSGGEYQRIAPTFREMGFEAIDERSESRICGPFGVPPILIGSRLGLNRSTYCLPADTHVETPRGPKHIIDLQKGDVVWSLNNGDLVKRNVLWQGCVGTKPLYEIKTKNRTLRATGNHPLLVYRKSRMDVPNSRRGASLEWKRVDELSQDDYVVQTMRYPEGNKNLLPTGERASPDKKANRVGLSDDVGLFKIVSIKGLPAEPVYDITVEGEHCFVAEGIVVHNSNYRLARQGFWEDTMIPEISLYEADYGYYLNQPGAFVRFDFSGVPALRKDVPELTIAWARLVDRGVPKNVAANVVGLTLPELPDGYVAYMPMNMLPVTEMDENREANVTADDLVELFQPDKAWNEYP